jgi:hypothetical protein
MESFDHGFDLFDIFHFVVFLDAEGMFRAGQQAQLNVPTKISTLHPKYACGLGQIVAPVTQHDLLEHLVPCRLLLNQAMPTTMPSGKVIPTRNPPVAFLALHRQRLLCASVRFGNESVSQFLELGCNEFPG